MTRLRQNGQTLIALLVFMLVAMTVTIAASAVAIINIQSNNNFTSGSEALLNANSGVEDTILKLERDPSYSGGTLNIGSGSATITVSGSGTLTIVSVGSSGNFQRTVTATITDTSNVMSLTSWSETP
jgi:ABC-type nitrate/sulfonate/bicarbonate transport system substrate-binding protein